MDETNTLVDLDLLCPNRTGIKRLKAVLDGQKTLLAASNYHHVQYSHSYSSSSSSSTSSSPIEDQQHYLSVDVSLKELLTSIRDCLKKQTGIKVEEIRLGGDVATSIFSNEKDLAEKEPESVNVVFKLSDLIEENQLHSVRSIVLQCFNAYLAATGRLSSGNFVSKTVKVWTERDRWTLISLGASPLNVDLIFVAKMARTYQFSVDSVQIAIDALLRDLSDENGVKIYAQSGYGDVEAAVSHVRDKIVTTKAPETIRGGGLLRYCDLRARGFKAGNGLDFDAKLEQIMCTRFFIDFPDIGAQAKEIERYLNNRFQSLDFDRKCSLLRLLTTVIQRSSLYCIMNRERRLAQATVASFIARETHHRNIIGAHSGLAFTRSV